MNELQRIELTKALLTEACAKRGHWVSGDGRIGEEAAADLLGFASGTMANNRREGKGPPSYRLGGQGFRVTYNLRDLAEWIESTRESSW